MNENSSDHGLRIHVYRNATHGDCSLNGISATHDGLTLVGMIDETVDRYAVVPLPRRAPHSVTEESPAAWLVKQSVMGRIDWYVRPADDPRRRPMMGGNLAYTSDSRFSEIVGVHGGVRIHDRYESTRI